jgi:hypothetical protein
MDDLVMVCFELFHEITFPVRVNIYLDMEFLSSIA